MESHNNPINPDPANHHAGLVIGALGLELPNEFDIDIPFFPLWCDMDDLPFDTWHHGT